jgi:hypothetical protein
MGQSADSFSPRAGLIPPVLVSFFMFCGTGIFTLEQTLWIFFSTRICGGYRMLAWYGPNGMTERYRMTGHHEVIWKLRWVPVGSVLCNMICSLIYVYIGDSKLQAPSAFYAHWVPRICCITLWRFISDHINFWALQIEEMPKLINCESKFLYIKTMQYVNCQPVQLEKH